MTEEQSGRERSSFSHKTIFTGLALSLALGFVAAIFIYNNFVTYTPTAMRRVPASALLVARLNTEQAVVYDPLTTSLLPMFERGHQGPESRLKHLERKTTVELNVDVRELVFARFADNAWVLIAAGLLRPDEVLEGVSRMLKDENVEHTLEDGMVVRPDGAAFAVAEDGTMLLGSSREVVSGSLQLGRPGEDFSKLQGRGVALGFFVASSTESPGSSNGPFSGGTVTIQADSHFPIRASLERATDSSSMESLQAKLGGNMNKFGGLLPLGVLQLQSEVQGRLSAKGTLSREQFNEAVEDFGALVEDAVFGGAKSASKR